MTLSRTPMMKHFTTFLASAALSLVASTAAHAAIVIYTWESGPDVLASFSGSLSGFETGSVIGPDTARIAPGVSFISFADGNQDLTLQFFDTFSGNTGSIFDAQAFATEQEGDNLVVVGPLFGGAYYLPAGYVQGTELSGSMRFADTDFETFGLIDGAVATGTAFGGDTITWRVGQSPAPVPLPASFPMVLAGLGALIWARRRKYSGTS